MEKTLAAILLTITLLSSCSESSKIKYDIISEKPNEASSKSNIEIRLANKIDSTDLVSIAKELRADRKDYNKLWIFYFLPGQMPGSGCWATTHFTPDLEVEILGTTSKEDKTMLDSAFVDGKVIYKWKNNGYMTECIYILYTDKNSNYTFKRVLPDGGSYLIPIKVTDTRIDYTEPDYTEYFIIEPNKNLGMYNKEGRKFEEAVLLVD